MELVYLVLISFAASWLTFFCGFGLGTILTPVYYFLFGDLTLAIAGTAIVHFLNNVFKFVLMNRKVDWSIALPFGLASVPAAFIGALCLIYFEDVALYTYQVGDRVLNVQLMNLLFGLLLTIFAILELMPNFSITLKRKYLWLGGAVSGFFGGLSGHQGALRTAFLTKYKLDKEVFVATGIVIALAVDIARSAEYFSHLDSTTLQENWHLIACSLGAALGGAVTGKYLLKKMDFKIMTYLIAGAMILFGVALAAGVLSN